MWEDVIRLYIVFPEELRLMELSAVDVYLNHKLYKKWTVVYTLHQHGLPQSITFRTNNITMLATKVN